MFNKELIAQLSNEINERITHQMENGKKERMQKFAKEDNTIDATGLIAFTLAEAKLFCSLYTTDFLMTLAEYEEMDKKLADGTLEMPEIEKASAIPMQRDENWADDLMTAQQYQERIKAAAAKAEVSRTTPAMMVFFRPTLEAIMPAGMYATIAAACASSMVVL